MENKNYTKLSLQSLIYTSILIILIGVFTYLICNRIDRYFKEITPRLSKAYELDIVDEKYILYDGDIPISILDSSEVDKLHDVIMKDNE